MKTLFLSLGLVAGLFGLSGTARADHGYYGGHRGGYPGGYQGGYRGGNYGGHHGYSGYRGNYPGYYGRTYAVPYNPYGYYAPYGYAYPYRYQPGVSFGVYRPGVAVQFGIYP